MGTTIKSTATNNAVHVFRCPGGDVLLSLRYGSAIYVRETDLKAALGFDELGCGCEEADDNLAAAIARAEKAEAFGAAAVARAEDAEGDAREWKARTDWWAESKESWKADAADWRARAERAEATVERVRALTVDGDGEWVHVGDLRGALDGKPAFTLPTETGARFEARNDYRGTITFRTVLEGPGQHKYLYEGKDVLWTGESVMEELTDHRMLGAES